MTTRFQQRRDTAANWTSNNPALAAGEFGFETNTSKFKIGDGSTLWTSLAYSGTITSLVAGTGLTGGTITASGTVAIDTAVTVDKTTAQTLTNKTLTSPTVGGGITHSGSTSGTTVLQATAVASGTLTLPAATDTLVGKATTDTLTNKTISAGTLTGTVTAGGSVGTSGYLLSTTGTGVQWVAAPSSYSAPTIGSTSIGSGSTVTTINGLTKLVSAQHTSLDGSGYEVDIALMQIMGAY